MNASSELAIVNPHPRQVLTDPRINEMFGRRDQRADKLGEQIDHLNDRIANLEATVARLERVIDRTVLADRRAA